MKLCGHSMGTPAMKILESIDFFASISLHGIEIRCAADGHLDPLSIDDVDLLLIKKHAHSHDLAIACLSPYYNSFSSDDMSDTLEKMEKTCRAATMLECGIVRAKSGIWPCSDTDHTTAWQQSVDGLLQAARIAERRGVRLALENHSGTLTQTAADTLAMIQAVSHPALGILYDPYWVFTANMENIDETTRMLAPHTIHVHCKNIAGTDGATTSPYLEYGLLDWPEILGLLHEAGYTGYLSDEYEKFWKKDFPPPQEAMARNARFLRKCLADL